MLIPTLINVLCINDGIHESDAHNHWAAVVSRGWAKASACHLQVNLSCDVFCHILSIQYLSRSSLHRLAGLPCHLFLSNGLQVVTRKVSQLSFKRVMCPGQDHFISFKLMIMSMTTIMFMQVVLDIRLNDILCYTVIVSQICFIYILEFFYVSPKKLFICFFFRIPDIVYCWIFQGKDGDEGGYNYGDTEWVRRRCTRGQVYHAGRTPHAVIRMPRHYGRENPEQWHILYTETKLKFPRWVCGVVARCRGRHPVGNTGTRLVKILVFLEIHHRRSMFLYCTHTSQYSSHALIHLRPRVGLDCQKRSRSALCSKLQLYVIQFLVANKVI